MSNTDFLIRGVINSCAVRFVYTEVPESLKEGIKIQDTDPVSSHLLGEALVNSVMISTLLNGTERYSLNWQYPGLIKSILADVNSRATVRVVMKEPYLMTKAENEAELYGSGDGQLSMVKFDGPQTLSSGFSKAPLHNIDGDTSFYFSTSDQIETETVSVIGLKADVDNPVSQASGMLLQALPDCDLELFAEMRDRLVSKGVKELFKQELPLEKKLRMILQQVTGMDSETLSFGVNTVYEFGEGTPCYKCSCSRERMLQALHSLSEAELEEIFSAVDMPRVKCEFCKKNYYFTADDFDNF